MQPDLRPILGADLPHLEQPKGAVAPLAFEDFFAAHRSKLFGALAVLTGNRAEAEEIMQDSFIAVLERWERVATMDDPEAYLYRTALNVFRQRLRRAAVLLRKAVHAIPPDDALSVVELRDEATRALARLTPRERQAIVLTGYLGYSTEEAGRILGIKGATVRVLTTRARATLRSGTGETN